ncbi:MAG: hypothetical protein JNM80_07345 [Phycisphaerae bacterium]|nr:hypothetical protein [Phycisphaerae bacterium]
MRVAALIAVLAGAALGQPPTFPSSPARPSARTSDCTASGCHASQMNHAFLHGPTAVQACDACHQYADVAKHTFDMKRTGRELCALCHIDKAGPEGRVVHEPVAKGDCTSCHDPHGGAARTLLKKDPVRTLCMDCHKDVLKGAHAHGPGATDCLACHKAHASDHERLLPRRSGSCASCATPRSGSRSRARPTRTSRPRAIASSATPRTRRTTRARSDSRRRSCACRATRRWASRRRALRTRTAR